MSALSKGGVVMTGVNSDVKIKLYEYMRSPKYDMALNDWMRGTFSSKLYEYHAFTHLVDFFYK